MTLKEFIGLTDFQKLEMAEGEIRVEVRMRRYVYAKKVMDGAMSRDEMDVLVGIMEYVLGVIMAKRDTVGVDSGNILPLTYGDKTDAEGKV